MSPLNTVISFASLIKPQILMIYFKYAAVFLIVIILSACSDKSDKGEALVNVYTHRHYDSDKKLFAEFEDKTGIQVNVVNASADELIKKLELEGKDSPADVLITVDAGRLFRAKDKELLQAIESKKLNQNIPERFRDEEGYWYGLTYRARIIACSEERVNDYPTTYESLTEKQWKNRVLVRSSGNIYNQSLLASMIAIKGRDFAKEWAQGIVENFARPPKGNDRDQIKAIAANQGDAALVNTYYIGKLLNSENPEEVEAGKTVRVIFPNQNGRGTHINVSGAGVTKHAPNRENAIKFIEFLSESGAQKVFAQANFEYPVKEGVQPAELLKSWGDFKADTLDLSLLGKYNREAVMIFDEVGWQ